MPASILVNDDNYPKPLDFLYIFWFSENR